MMYGRNESRSSSSSGIDDIYILVFATMSYKLEKKPENGKYRGSVGRWSFRRLTVCIRTHYYNTENGEIRMLRGNFGGKRGILLAACRQPSACRVPDAVGVS